MKKVFLCSILFCAIAMPSIGELTVEDLEKIRSIVSGSEERVTTEIAKINTKIDKIDTRLRTVETDVATIKGHQTGQKTGTETKISSIIAIVAVAGLVVSILPPAVSTFFKKETPLEQLLTQLVKQLSNSRTEEKTP